MYAVTENKRGILCGKMVEKILNFDATINELEGKLSIYAEMVSKLLNA